MEKPSSPVLEMTLCWESSVKGHLTAEPRGSPMRSSADSGFGSQLFMNDVGEPSPLSLECSADRSNVSDPRANADCKGFSERPDRSLPEDSGISLSTGSPTLKRTSSYTESPNGGNYCRKEMVVNVTQGYLKQLQPQKPNSLEDEDLEKTWQPQVKDYRSQGPENPHKDQVDCDIFREPWIQVPGTFQTALPLTAAFSPFRRALWDIGVSAPSLGDVELLDTRS
ncbi:hypothetical protein GDO78_011276 [Eleutherodactylus coqui]|uniref:Uncharacterized protein n=2 Tax=Eleutherodactylus coqui TaxID=57060 RepID=A0A8J6F8D5_ELECQ|nr:hypothetical protein GDO78_011276 [Eleutherodactylus coqui]